MRKITLFVAAIMLSSLSLLAQNISKPVSPSQGNMRQTLSASKSTHQKNMTGEMRAKLKLNTTPAKSPSKVTPIEEQPDGKYYGDLITSYNSLVYNFFYGWMNMTTDVARLEIVEGNDGNVYIKGLCSNSGMESFYWLKATKEDGDIIKLEQQPIGYYYDYMGEKHEYEIARIDYSYNEETNTEDIKISDDPTIRFHYTDGKLSTLDEMNSTAGDISGNIFGSVYWYEASEDDDYESGWYTNNEYYWNLSSEILNETYNEPSANATIEDMVMKYKNADQSMAKPLQVAFEGNDVYMKLYNDVPGWVKGSIEGDKVVVNNSQFMGYDSYYNNYHWAHTATVELMYYDAGNEDDSYYYDMGTIVDKIEFSYDAATKTMTTEDGIYIDSAKDRIYYADHFVAPTIYFFEEVAATPADPIISKFWDYEDYYGNAELDFNINVADVDGNYINSDKLSYAIYVDDELFEATTDEYEITEESMTEFPYGFSSDRGYIGSNYFCVFFQPVKNMGIQTIYRGAGDERRSNIVLYDIESGSIITVNKDLLGINEVGNATTTLAGTYDLQGRKVGENTKGIVIKRMSNADGTLKTVKVIRK